LGSVRRFSFPAWSTHHRTCSSGIIVNNYGHPSQIQATAAANSTTAKISRSIHRKLTTERRGASGFLIPRAFVTPTAARDFFSL
jgi:hypothetical protein